jgi:hypothetical protein
MGSLANSVALIFMVALLVLAIAGMGPPAGGLDGSEQLLSFMSK